MLLHIQILRFFAAAAVVAFHAWGVTPRYGVNLPEGIIPHLLSRSGHGVDLFFVISGFIIFYATHGSDGRLRLTAADFLRRRVERIAPLYFVVIAAVTVLALTWPEIFGTPDWYTPRHIVKSLAFIAFTDGDMPVVYVGWSLEYEMYFYLAVALLMALTRSPWRNIVVTFSTLAILGLIPGVATALGPYSFFTDPLILEFTLGVIVGYVFATGRIDWPMVAAMACAIAALLAMDIDSRAIWYGLPGAGLVAAAAWLSNIRTTASWLERALARLGDASYSIYLAQVQTVTFACKAITEAMPEIPPIALIGAVSAIVVMLGLLLNIAVERPLLRLCRSIGKSRPALPRSAPMVL
jgi:exopolysaccharide production protein ExoZ